MVTPKAEPMAWFGGMLATGLVATTADVADLEHGWWAVVVDFEGRLRAGRFTDVRPAPLPTDGTWQGTGSWRSSLGRDDYVAAVAEIRERIARGDLYQVNLCRVLDAEAAPEADIVALAARLQAQHRAPYAGVVRLPGLVEVATASPELFLSRDGDIVRSQPIKGTGATAEQLTDKDRAENVMIVDLVRNDLGRVAAVGGVDVPALCVVEEHPGLAHLVSHVRARLRPGTTWAQLLGATWPPGSVSGAPKSAALAVIEELETVARGPYCGAVGWIDGDRRRAVLAVGIRSFWLDGGTLRFGTGAGITWGSDPLAEWGETELKARRLLSIASGSAGPDGSPPLPSTLVP